MPVKGVGGALFCANLILNASNVNKEIIKERENLCSVFDAMCYIGKLVVRVNVQYLCWALDSSNDLWQICLLVCFCFILDFRSKTQNQPLFPEPNVPSIPWKEKKRPERKKRKGRDERCLGHSSVPPRRKREKEIKGSRIQPKDPNGPFAPDLPWQSN